MTIPYDTFMGGCAAYTSMSADVDLYVGHERMVVLIPQSAGLAVNLPDARDFRVGGPHFVVLEVNGAYSVDVKDAGGGTVGTLAASSAGKLFLSENDTLAGRWSMRVQSLL